MFVIIILSCLMIMSSHAAPIAPSTSQVMQRTTRSSASATSPAPSYSIVNNNQGKVYEWQSDSIDIRLSGAQTQGLFTLSEDKMKSAFKIGLHLHRKHAETFHILEGEVEFRLGSRTHVAGVGTTIHVPPNIAHAARVINGRPARMLMVYAPAGFEHFLEEMKTFTDAQFADAQFMKTFNEKYDNYPLE